MKPCFLQRYMLCVCVLAVCLMACSKSPAPEPVMVGGGQDSICVCNDSSNNGGTGGNTGGGTNTGINDSSGVTVIEKIYTHSLFYWANNKGELTTCATETTDGRHLRLRYSDTGMLRTRLVNADRNAMTVKLVRAYTLASTYSVSFPNIHAYTSLYGVPDTAQKLQLWVFRADGKDILPKKGANPAINRIIQVFGTIPANAIGEGELWLQDFVRPQAHITWDFLDSTFTHSTWTLYKYGS